LEDGSKQADIWGANWISGTREIICDSLINIRPKQMNAPGFNLNVVIRNQVVEIVRRITEET